MENPDYIKYQKSHKNKKKHYILLAIGLIIAICISAFIFTKKYKENIPVETKTSTEETTVDTSTEDDISKAISETIEKANIAALSYDYDKAIEIIRNDNLASNSDAGYEAISQLESEKDSLVRQDTEKITHIFFHSLIADPSKAFDGDRKEGGYNQMMCTVDEFKKILQQMYDRGFVLVSIHDIAYEIDDPDSDGKKMVSGNIMLPEGKKAFVMSQDDVCYYEYMKGDGFADRIVIGDDGKPTCEMTLDDGSVVQGAYDLVPILDEFIEEHPDFSYKGAKAILAFTGYNGILGYRTGSAYADSPTLEEEKEKATKVASALREDGYEFASHSWGHRYYGQISYEEFKIDADKWQDEVAPLISGTDIMIFAFGDDISDWHKYTDGNAQFDYLYAEGFRYFCNVDSSQYWIQYGHDHLRQGRRNIDGYRMWRDITEPDSPRLSDLFDVSTVFDQSRPTPVPSMSGS